MACLVWERPRYTSRRRLRWMRGGRWGAIGPAALLLSLRLFLPGARSSSHVWDHLISGKQCKSKGCLQSTVLSLHLRSSPLSCCGALSRVRQWWCGARGPCSPGCFYPVVHTTPLHSGSSAHLRSCQSHQGSAQSLTIAHESRCLCHYFQGLSLAKPWTASVSNDAQAD